MVVFCYKYLPVFTLYYDDSHLLCFVPCHFLLLPFLILLICCTFSSFTCPFSHIHHIHFFLVTFYVYARARVCHGLCSEVISRMKTSFGHCSDLFCAFLIMLLLLHNKNRSILAAGCFLVINTLNAVYISHMFIFVFLLDALSIFS